MHGIINEHVPSDFHVKIALPVFQIPRAGSIELSELVVEVFNGFEPQRAQEWRPNETLQDVGWIGWDARHINGELHDLHGLGRKIVPVALYVPHELLGFGIPGERSLIEFDGMDAVERIQELFSATSGPRASRV